MKGNKPLSTLCGATVLHKPSRGETGTYLIREACFRRLFVFFNTAPILQYRTYHCTLLCVLMCAGVHRICPRATWTAKGTARYPLDGSPPCSLRLSSMEIINSVKLPSQRHPPVSAPTPPQPWSWAYRQVPPFPVLFFSKEGWGPDLGSLNFRGKFSSG